LANAPLRAENLKTILPDSDYVGITLTLPMEFGAILQQNRHILHGIPTMERRPFNNGQKLDMACGGLSLSYNRPLVDSSISFLICTYSVSRRFAGVRESLDPLSEARSSRVDACRAYCSYIAFLSEAFKRNKLCF